MASAPTIGIDALSTPIPGDNPSGKDLRDSPVYDAIREARRADDDRHAVPGTPAGGLKRSDWPAVIKLATQALTNDTKDLQIAVWLLEAIVEQKGFGGLRDGLHLLRALQEGFWDSLYPAVEDGDLEGRAAPLEWLNDKHVRSIRLLPLTNSPSGKKFSWWNYDEAVTLDQLRASNPSAAEELITEGKTTREEFDKAVGTTSLQYYQALLEDLEETGTQCAQLIQVIDAKFGNDAPSLREVRQAIVDCRDLVKGFVKAKGGLVGPQAEESAASANGELVAAGATGAGGALPIEPRNRADALERLRAVARFFRRTEPHSPVSYLVQRAVAWGEMPLEKWLQEVIPNDDVLARVRETLGLKAPESHGDANQ